MVGTEIDWFLVGIDSLATEAGAGARARACLLMLGGEAPRSAVVGLIIAAFDDVIAASHS